MFDDETEGQNVNTALHFLLLGHVRVALRKTFRTKAVAPPVVKKAADAVGFMERTPQREEAGLRRPHHNVTEKPERCQVCATERRAEGSINQRGNVWTTGVGYLVPYTLVR